MDASQDGMSVAGGGGGGGGGGESRRESASADGTGNTRANSGSSTGQVPVVDAGVFDVSTEMEREGGWDGS